MVAKNGPGRKARVPYKVVITLFPHEWDELRMEAQSRGIKGDELLSSVVSRYIAQASPPDDAPPPDEPPSDA